MKSPAKRALLKCRRGVTLMELIVSVMVLSIIMIAVTTVFAPMLRVIERANNFAEANAMLDSISAYIMKDVADATGITAGSGAFTIRTSYNIEYYTNEEGILCRRAPGFDKPVLHKDYYKHGGAQGDKAVFSISAACAADDGLVTITLTLTAGDGWELTREYLAKPTGLVVGTAAPGR